MVGLVSSGAWAQFAAVPVSRLAPVPGPVSDPQAATLPTAGLTALRALEVGGLVLGKRMLVTGATGGVGRMAVQLARASGAHVTVTEQLDGDFDLIIDGVGGATFGLAIEHLAPRGVVVNIATQDDDETVTFRASRFDRARGARIYTLNLPDELASHASAAVRPRAALRPDCRRTARWPSGTPMLMAAAWPRDQRPAGPHYKRQGHTPH